MADNKIVVDIGAALETLMNNPELTKQMNSLVLGSPMADELEKATQIVQIVKSYIEKHEISCAESIYQRDKIWETAPELVEELANIVGYYEYPEDDE